LILRPEQVENQRSILDTFDNPRPGREYEIKFVFPDFATITITYVPDRRCVEMKSLKLYFFSYRDKGIFYEAVTNTILDDLVSVLAPIRMTVIGEFAVRGGTAGTVTVHYDRDGRAGARNGRARK